MSELKLRNGLTKSRSKFGANKIAGYDSEAEYYRARELKLLEKAGEISELEEQPVYQLIPKQDGEQAAIYTADFRYREKGELIVEDVKSPATEKKPDFVLRRKLMLQVHGIKLRITHNKPSRKVEKFLGP